MVHITYMHGMDSNEENKFVLREYPFYISDDRCHDLSYVHHFFQSFYNQLKEKSILMDQHCIWSDGCANQLKIAHVFQRLCMLHKKLKVPHILNCSDSEHGKGEHDGVGSCIKRVLRRKKMKFTTTSLIQNEKSIVE
jgi:hypothetical protein